MTIRKTIALTIWTFVAKWCLCCWIIKIFQEDCFPVHTELELLSSYYYIFNAKAIAIAISENALNSDLHSVWVALGPLDSRTLMGSVDYYLAPWQLSRKCQEPLNSPKKQTRRERSSKVHKLLKGPFKTVFLAFLSEYLKAEESVFIHIYTLISMSRTSHTMLNRSSDRRLTYAFFIFTN